MHLISPSFPPSLPLYTSQSSVLLLFFVVRTGLLLQVILLASTVYCYTEKHSTDELRVIITYCVTTVADRQTERGALVDIASIIGFKKKKDNTTFQNYYR